jgi:thiol:disulfide interchange protein DsbD
VAVKLGYKRVFRYVEGYPEWHAEGLPTECAPVIPLTAAPAEAEGPGVLQGWAAAWTLLAIFLGGMALSLTPCIYPLIPVTVSYFAGRSGLGRGRLPLHGLLYLLGLAVSNSFLGLFAALTGSLIGEMLQKPVVLGSIAGVLVVLASSMFGLWELRLPAGLATIAAKPRVGYIGSLLMGMTLGLVAAPCIGPFVLGLLAWVASMGSAWLGFIVFFTLSLGLGLPLFVLALFSGMLEKLPRSGEWMVWVRKLMGWVLVAMAAYFIRPVLPESFGAILPGLVLLLAGIHLGWLERTKIAAASFEWIRTVAGIAALVTATVLIGSWAMERPEVAWQPYSDLLRDAAKTEGQLMVIDFSAAWCSPCRAMDRITFRDPRVVNRVSGDAVMVKVDLTRKGSPLHERLIGEFDVKGVPTVVFLDRNGTERRDLRAVAYLTPEQFLRRLAQASERGED